MEDEEEEEEEAKGGVQKSRGLHLVAGKKCFSMLLLGNTGGGFFSRCSAKARESGFQTHGGRERKTLHRERFAKEMAKGKTE